VTGLSGIRIHGVQEVVLKDERTVKAASGPDKASWVRVLQIKHDGGTTSIELFADHNNKLKVIPK
jgi:hypothetical protein